SILSLLAYYIGISCAMQSDQLKNFVLDYNQIQIDNNLSDSEIMIFKEFTNWENINNNAWNIKFIRDGIGHWSPNVFKSLIYSGSALSFITLTTCLGSNVISLRSNKSIFKENIKDQQYAIYSFLGSYATTAFIAYTPYVNYTFSMDTYSYNHLTVSYGSNSWINIYPYLAVLVILFIHEITKIIDAKLLSKRN
ncbi:MAG: cation transporting ATPase C-terminal domain-containing protein, partial [Ureaplasma sp.]|nr:cation transporting ATPase C-terminal domain-containing protein [Ureaplasma sp.]